MCGATYMLTQDEELWEKTLPPAVEDLLSEAKDPLADRSDRGEDRNTSTAFSMKDNNRLWMNLIIIQHHNDN